jgi:hypothetical protein
VDFHSPGSDDSGLEVFAKALRFGFKIAPKAPTVAAAVAVLKKLFRVILFSFSFILKSFLSSISVQVS